MVATSVASFLLVLALAVGKQYAAADTTISGSEDASLVVNVATVASNSVHENLSSVAEEMAMQGTPNDFVLVGNTSFSDMWLDGVAGYSAAADSRVVYQTTNWTLLEDGAQYETFPMFWARFQAAKSSATASSLLSICTMVVDWQNVSESAAAFGAVKVEDD
ncbi:unnamed protein product [Phytophthora lilii]|uniref:Unnamed protein product n=1 Tax=Phytophthora lilii TaxID=2077276 RepID=A0A9W6TFS3_9STRA|nr:unnamed protein product [Phytophthora lilii]